MDHGSATTDAALAEAHTPDAVQKRIVGGGQVSYLRDFIYGSIDGCVTTFSVVSGVVGAELSTPIILIPGFANLLGDGLSMAVSNYLGTKADRDVVRRIRDVEEMHIDRIPDGEVREIREIFRQKGFKGKLLDQIVEVITSNRDLWVDTMVTEEWGASLSGVTPWKAGAVTFVAFVLVGLIPLAPFIVGSVADWPTVVLFWGSTFVTLLTFFVVGALKSRFSTGNWVRAGLETLAMGGSAAAVAYAVGFLLSGLAR